MASWHSRPVVVPRFAVHVHQLWSPDACALLRFDLIPRRSNAEPFGPEHNDSPAPSVLRRIEEGTGLTRGV